MPPGRGCLRASRSADDRHGAGSCRRAGMELCRAPNTGLACRSSARGRSPPFCFIGTKSRVHGPHVDPLGSKLRTSLSRTAGFRRERVISGVYRAAKSATAEPKSISQTDTDTCDMTLGRRRRAKGGLPRTLRRKGMPRDSNGANAVRRDRFWIHDPRRHRSCDCCRVGQTGAGPCARTPRRSR